MLVGGHSGGGRSYSGPRLTAGELAAAAPVPGGYAGTWALLTSPAGAPRLGELDPDLGAGLLTVPDTIGDLRERLDLLEDALRRYDDPGRSRPTLRSGDGTMNARLLLSGPKPRYEIVWTGPDAPPGGVRVTGGFTGGVVTVSAGAVSPDGDGTLGDGPWCYPAEDAVEALFLSGDQTRPGSSLDRAAALLLAHQSVETFLDFGARKLGGPLERSLSVREVADACGRTVFGDGGVDLGGRDVVLAHLAATYPQQAEVYASMRAAGPSVGGGLHLAVAAAAGDDALTRTVAGLSAGWHGTCDELLVTAAAVLGRDLRLPR